MNDTLLKEIVLTYFALKHTDPTDAAQAAEHVTLRDKLDTQMLEARQRLQLDAPPVKLSQDRRIEITRLVAKAAEQVKRRMPVKSILLQNIQEAEYAIDLGKATMAWASDMQDGQVKVDFSRQKRN